MSLLIRLALRYPLLANLALVLVAVVGVLSWYAMPQEMFPVVELDRVAVTTRFPGASPREVERLVTLPVEDALEGLADIDTLTATSAEGLSTVVARLGAGADVDDFLRRARQALDRIRQDLPADAEDPVLRRLRTRFPVISVALYGEAAPGYLEETARELKRRLLELPGVAGAGVTGQRGWELRVEADPGLLAARGLGLQELAAALAAGLAELPGGSLRTGAGEVLLRGAGAPPDPEAVAALPVRLAPGGGRLQVGDVARVSLALAEPRTLGRFNGRPSVNLTVTKTARASTIEVARRVRELVARFQRELPPGVRVGVFSDFSLYVQRRLDTVKSSGLVGLLLVTLALYAFLNARVALITALGIPVSFLVALILLHELGYSINMVSLFAFLIALGLVVDDAIIVTENIYRHLEAGEPPERAALEGAREVAAPVTAATATTVAAFLPMFAVGGTMGAFIAVIPVVVGGALLGSLLEAFGVLPAHAAAWLRAGGPEGRRRGRIPWERLREQYAAWMEGLLQRRYLVALGALGLFGLSVQAALTHLPFRLFGDVETGQFFVHAEAPVTYSLEDSAALAARMEQEVLAALAPRGELRSLLTNVGVSFVSVSQVRFGSHLIQLVVDLEPERPRGLVERWVAPLLRLEWGAEGRRERTTEAVMEELRQRLAALPGVRHLSVMRPRGGPTGPDVEVGITGPSATELSGLAEAVAAFLRSLPGVRDVRHDLEEGKLELHYRLTERGRELGLTQAALAEAVRAGFQGLEAVDVTWRGRRVPVRVLYPEAVRHGALDLERLPVPLPRGGVALLGQVAELRWERGFRELHRRDGRPMVTVTAEVERGTSALAVAEAVREAFAGGLPSGYRMLFLGERREAVQSVADLVRALVVALALIFFILVALFRSLLDPLVVMAAIPLGFVGVVAGHALMGVELEFLSLIGFLALAGIVVNDSLILVEFAKRLRERGVPRERAVAEAAAVRARPILLTSVTTFLGISPLIFLASGQAAFLTPMAVSLGFGLLGATVLILVAVPCLYLIADDLRARLLGAGRG